MKFVPQPSGYGLKNISSVESFEGGVFQRNRQLSFQPASESLFEDFQRRRSGFIYKKFDFIQRHYSAAVAFRIKFY